MFDQDNDREPEPLRKSVYLKGDVNLRQFMQPIFRQRCRSTWSRLWLLTLLVGLAGSSFLRGSEIAKPSAVLEDEKKAAVAVAGAVAQGDSFTAISLLFTNRDILGQLAEDEKPPELAPKVFLVGVRDGREMLTGGKEEE